MRPTIAAVILTAIVTAGCSSTSEDQAGEDAPIKLTEEALGVDTPTGSAEAMERRGLCTNASEAVYLVTVMSQGGDPNTNLGGDFDDPAFLRVVSERIANATEALAAQAPEGEREDADGLAKTWAAYRDIAEPLQYDPDQILQAVPEFQSKVAPFQAGNERFTAEVTERCESDPNFADGLSPLP